jgi:hypothetical protein
MLSSAKHKLINGSGFVIAIVTAAVVGGASTAAVLAAIPDSNGAIHGCYRTAGGANASGGLRVINSENGETCSNQETALNWN